MVHNLSILPKKKKKNTFSILHTNFYKTPTSVYLLYTLFYINNIFLFYFSLTLKLSASLFSLTHKLTSQSLPLSHPSKSASQIPHLSPSQIPSLSHLFLFSVSLIQYPHTHKFSLSLLSLCQRSLHCWISLI